MNKNDGIDEVVWHQGIGTDALPSLDNTKSAVTLGDVTTTNIGDTIINDLIAAVEKELEAKDAEA